MLGFCSVFQAKIITFVFRLLSNANYCIFLMELFVEEI